MKVVWKMPIPSTALLEEPTLIKRPGGEFLLEMEYESDEDERVSLELQFLGVESYKVTLLHACTLEQLDAYDSLVCVGSSHWLAQVVRALKEGKRESEHLAQFRILFDEGPCYEFICHGYRVVKRDDS